MVERKTAIKTATKVTKTTANKKPSRRQRKQKPINLDQEFYCINVTPGELVYRSRKSGYQVVWSHYGDYQYVLGKELVDMNASQPAFTHNPWIYIDDQELVNYLGLTNVQKQAKTVIDINQLFSMTPTEIKNLIRNMTSDLKELVFVQAREGIRSGRLQNMAVVNALNEVFKKNLYELI